MNDINPLMVGIDGADLYNDCAGATQALMAQCYNGLCEYGLLKNIKALNKGMYSLKYGNGNNSNILRVQCKGKCSENPQGCNIRPKIKFKYNEGYGITQHSHYELIDLCYSGLTPKISKFYMMLSKQLTLKDCCYTDKMGIPRMYDFVEWSNKRINEEKEHIVKELNKRNEYLEAHYNYLRDVNSL